MPTSDELLDLAERCADKLELDGKMRHIPSFSDTEDQCEDEYEDRRSERAREVGPHGQVVPFRRARRLPLSSDSSRGSLGRGIRSEVP